MKRNERLFEAMSGIDSTLIAAATPGTHKKSAPAWRHYLPAVACLALAATIGIAAWQMNTPDPVTDDKRQPENMYNAHEEVLDTVAATGNELGIIPHWDEMNVSEQFGAFTVGEIEYRTRVCTVDAALIGEQLGQATAQGYDIYTDTTHTAALSYYDIPGYANECVVGVQFEGDTDYYVYINSWYRPETLGQLLDDMNLRDVMTFGNFYADYFNSDGNLEHVTFHDPDDSIVWEQLLSDPSLENVYNETGWYGSVLSVSVNIPLLGERGGSIWLTEDGHLVTNILDTGKAFFIGREAVEQFLLYIALHCPDREVRVTVIEREDVATAVDDGGIVEMTTQAYTPAHDPNGEPQTPADTTARPANNPGVTMTSAAYTPETVEE